MLERFINIFQKFFCPFSTNENIGFISFSNYFNAHLFVSLKLFHGFRVFFDLFEFLGQILPIFGSIYFN